VRQNDAYQGVDEILQADVMRFMAIIAFCLIAILALVRGAEPSSAQPSAQPPARASDEVVDPRPAPPPEPVLTLRPPPPAPARRPDVVPEPSLPAEPAPEPLAVARPTPEPAPAAPAEAQPKREAAAAPARQKPAAEDGLSLRFASERDFLRLVNRGDIRVFAFRDGEVLSVSADFRFQPASAPERLHELLPETIPDLMAAALHSTRDGAARSSAAYRWGIAMPERMARQIRGYLQQGVTGELVIDRHGEVRHHEA